MIVGVRRLFFVLLVVWVPTRWNVFYRKDLENWRPPYWIKINYSPPGWLLLIGTNETSFRRFTQCNSSSQYIEWLVVKYDKRFCVYLWSSIAIYLVWGGNSCVGGRIGAISSRTFKSSLIRTNHQNRGWTSADRSTKATLMLTVPRSLFKSSTKDLTRPT